MNIAILSASVRHERNSHRVATYFKNFIEENQLGTVDLIDLDAYQFPIFHERLRFTPEPPADVLDFANRIKNADGVLIVTPEYNGGYPAALKNVVDLLYAEWQKKPLALAAVSDGPFAASQVVTSLAFTFWKIGAFLSTGRFHVANVKTSYNEAGVPADKEGTDKNAKRFINELLWCMEAKKRMDA